MTDAAAIEPQIQQQEPTPNVLATAAQNTEAPANDDWLPEKYKVTNDSGLDIEASARKVAEAYRHLEKRMGAGDVPPKSPEEYAPAITAEGFDIETLKQDENYKGFLKAAHAKGLTNEQVSFVLDEYLSRAPALVQGAQALDDKACQDQLRSVWQSDADFTNNLQLSVKALTAVAGDDAERLMEKYGNDPDIIMMLAKFGADMQEDTPPAANAMPDGLDFAAKVAELTEQIQALPVGDPRRTRLMQEKDALYERKYGNKPANTTHQTVRN